MRNDRIKIVSQETYFGIGHAVYMDNRHLCRSDMEVIMKAPCKVNLIDQISEYLNVRELCDNDLRYFRRDLLRLSIRSLGILIFALQRMYK